MNEYNKKRNMGHITYTNVITSATLKPHPKSIEEVRVGNFFVPVIINLPLIENLSQAIKESTKQLKALSFIYLKGAEALTALFMILPFNLAKLAFYSAETKFSFVLSSIPGPRSGF